MNTILISLKNGNGQFQKIEDGIFHLRNSAGYGLNVHAERKSSIVE